MKRRSVVEILESLTSVYIDKAVQIVSSDVAAGRVIRNGNEEWITGCNRYLGKCSAFDAKLWGILDRLALNIMMVY
ncbi:hypothetical protein J1N35_006935 [Gossypium stocksii]|uniref:Uncharacterized protein n=1 Tax=Gossypium stocksii TaxID=47602 RepID=A0A9D3W630_9ROSI|nr:hypothetical protein J1N35_006935 [Gossypium stocksii]